MASTAACSPSFDIVLAALGGGGTTEAPRPDSLTHLGYLLKKALQKSQASKNKIPNEYFGKHFGKISQKSAAAGPRSFSGPSNDTKSLKKRSFASRLTRGRHSFDWLGLRQHGKRDTEPSPPELPAHSAQRASERPSPSLVPDVLRSVRVRLVLTSFLPFPFLRHRSKSSSRPSPARPSPSRWSLRTPSRM